MKTSICLTLFLAALLAASLSDAARQPVLGQIDLPHPSYYREMYLPQLTSGPSSLAWSPNSERADLFDGGFLVAPSARFQNRTAIDRWLQLRLPA